MHAEMDANNKVITKQEVNKQKEVKTKAKIKNKVNSENEIKLFKDENYIDTVCAK